MDVKEGNGLDPNGLMGIGLGTGHGLWNPNGYGITNGQMESRVRG